MLQPWFETEEAPSDPKKVTAMVGAVMGIAEALQDKPSRPDHVWNRIPDDVRQRIVAMALGLPLSCDPLRGSVKCAWFNEHEYRKWIANQYRCC
jgi:hypothetical protein